MYLTEAQLINKLTHMVSRIGYFETAKTVNICLNYFQEEQELPKYNQLLNAWHYVLRSNTNVLPH